MKKMVMIMIVILSLISLFGCQQTAPALECTGNDDCTGKCGGSDAPAGYEELVQKCIDNKCVCTSPTGEPMM